MHTDRKEVDFKKPTPSTAITFITLVAHAVTLTHFLLLLILHTKNWNACMCVRESKYVWESESRWEKRQSEDDCESVFKFVSECKCKFMSVGKW